MLFHARSEMAAGASVSAVDPIPPAQEERMGLSKSGSALRPQLTN